jgi:hypothetical protein
MNDRPGRRLDINRLNRQRESDLKLLHDGLEILDEGIATIPALFVVSKVRHEAQYYNIHRPNLANCSCLRHCEPTLDWMPCTIRTFHANLDPDGVLVFHLINVDVDVAPFSVILRNVSLQAKLQLLYRLRSLSANLRAAIFRSRPTSRGVS